MKDSVVSGENEQCVVVHTHVLEFGDDVSHHVVYLGRHPVHALHGDLVVLGCVETLPPPFPTFVVLREEPWHFVPRFLRCRCGDWDGSVPIHWFGVFLGLVLVGIHLFVPRMCSEKANGQ